MAESSGSQWKLGILLAGILLLSVLSVSVAYSLFTTSSSNTSPQSIGTSNWSASAGIDSSSASTGSAYGPITPSNAGSCTSLTKQVTSGWTAGRIVTLSNTTGLVTGMTVSGTGIINPGSNSISLIVSNTILLASGPNTSPNGTTLTFRLGVCTYDQYLSINNRGLTDLASFTVFATSTSTSGNSIALQACVGGTWSEATGICSGAISTLTTTIGAGTGANSPQTALVSISLAQGATLRLRALSTESGASLSVAVRVAQVNLRASTSTNG